MLNEANIENSSLEGETFATTRDEKRRRVQRQPRDNNGRWVAAGANVKWTRDSKHFTGVVKDLKDDGNAVVSVNHPDGNSSDEVISTGDLTVSTSKARLSKPDTEHFATDNSFNNVINSPKFLDDLMSTGQATINRADGYQLQARKDKSEGNPIIYQLFAPGGRSLGQYGEDAVKSFDDMVSADKGADVVAPVVASASVLRVSRKSNRALVKNIDTYQVIDMNLNQKVIHETSNYKEVLSFDNWRRPLKHEIESLTASIATKSEVTIDEPAKPAPYRVPDAVRSEIVAALESATDIPLDDLEKAKSLAYNDSVTEDEIKWINSFFTTVDTPQKLRGGYKGQKWASKILSKEPIEEDTTYSIINEDTLSYFAVGNDAENVTELLGIDFENDEVKIWDNGNWRLVEDLSIDDVDEPFISEIDHESARSFAQWKDTQEDATSFDLLSLDPEERNLFALAESEMDMEQLDRLTSVVADAGYTPVERSVNAQNQPRAAGGRFGSKQDAAEPVVSEPEKIEVEKIIKARLEEELPIVVNTATRINEWLLSAPITAAAEVEIDAGEVETEPETETRAESKSLYFAIVDEVDKLAVLDVVAITKNDLGEPEAWLRSGGTWKPAANLLVSLQGAAPPPVVELDVPDPVKAVLAQVDEFDNKSSAAPAAPATTAPAAAPAAAPTATDAKAPVTAGGYSKEQREKDAKKGYALPSGAYPIHNEEDLKKAVKAFGRAKDSEKKEVKRHIKKRAKALNRMDLIPDNWRETSITEHGEALLSQSPLYGSYGEVITAAGGFNGVAGEARLKAYWRNGKGAAKIRWGSPGDLTRCHRYLSKYIPGRAWGFCQNLHMDKYGVSNRTKDGK